MSTKDNLFDDFSSNVKRITIPLPNFKYYHGASYDHTKNRNFIGRESLITKLKDWLTNNQTKSGAYLVTGYRGMGKTSFVNNVLNQITYKQPGKYISFILFILYVMFVFSLYNFTSLISYAEGKIQFYVGSFNARDWIRFLSPFLLGIIISIIAIFVKQPSFSFNDLSSLLKKGIFKNRIKISLNLGHEVLNEKDILSLISRSILEAYSKYMSNLYIYHPFYYMCKQLFYVIFSLLLMHIYFISYIPFYEKILELLSSCSCDFIYSLLEGFKTFFNKLGDSLGEKGKEIAIFCICYYFTISLKNMLDCLMMHTILFPRKFPHVIKKKLIRLNERINAVYSEESGISNSTGKTFILSFFSKKGKLYPLANVREIEQELIYLLEQINASFGHPEFIIVFDELDKIDVYKDKNDETESSILPEFENMANGFQGGATSRRRKQNILNLLANMKFFTSSADAKFIFIAGRELYDAFLADVSDRQFAISSIFNGVIYVESFLSSGDETKDITLMSEMYICKQIIPIKYVRKIKKDIRNKKEKSIYDGDKDREIYTLKNYHNYLVNEIYTNKEDREKNKLVIQKTIIQLYHFAVYLSHISNGAPKKIAINFEKYVYSGSDKSIDDNMILLANKKPEDKQIYLSLGYKDQRKINFIHYMAYPVIQAIINNATSYGDKLLLSASFLTDHIYKHHSNGFSWRNLELVPELLDPNKTPELRTFINSIISYLKQTHLSSIYSSVYCLKFPQKISEEISIFSKLEEEVAAMFSFTLDESLSVKYYYAKLLEYNSKNGISKKNDNNLMHYRVMANIHHILGDLYLADEEYTNAIFEYQKCANLLRTKIESSDSDSQFILLFYLRNMLKLGLAYEKRKTNNSAYFLYAELTNVLEMFWNKKNKKLLSDKPYKSQANDTAECISPVIEDIRFICKPFLCKLFAIEKMELGGITRSELNKVIAEFDHLGINNNILKTNFYKELADIFYYKKINLNETTFISYQWDDQLNSLFSKFIDKNSSYNKLNEKRNEEEKEKIKKVIFDFIDNYFDNKKNSKQNEDTIISPDIKEDDLISFMDQKYIKLDSTHKKNKQLLAGFIKSTFEEKWNILKKINDCIYRQHTCCSTFPCLACKFYNLGLTTFLEKNGYKENTSMASKSIYLLQKKDELKNIREEQFAIIASTIDSMGNVLICCSLKEETISTDFLTSFLEMIDDENPQYKNINGIKLSFIEKAILYFWTASEYYQSAQNPKDSAQCSKKIIQILLTYLKTHPRDNDLRNIIHSSMEKIRDKIISKILHKLYAHYENINLIEIEHIKQILTPNGENVKLQSLSFLSIYPDIEELVCNYSELELTILPFVADNSLKVENISLLKNRQMFLSNCRIDSTISERISSLKLKVLINHQIFSHIFKIMDDNWEPYIYHQNSISSFYTKLLSLLENKKSDIIVSLGVYSKLFESIKNKEILHTNQNENEEDKRTIKNKLDLIDFLIGDSIFCLSKIIEVIPSAPSTKLYTQSYIGDIYRSLYEWYRMYDLMYVVYQYIPSNKEKKKMNKQVLHDKLTNWFKNKRYYDESSKRISDTKDEIDVIIVLRQYITKKLVYAKINPDMHNHSAFKKKYKLPNFDSSSYHAEMAINKFNDAIEMHNGGKAYKEMISNMYLLNDDLNNDINQFQFAIERYKINCEYIENIKKRLDQICDHSSIYKIDKYLN